MEDSTQKNYYEVLDISPAASIEEINRAYEIAVHSYDEESNAMYSLLSSEECAEISKTISEAYEVLSDPNKRIQYDKAKGIIGKKALEATQEGFFRKETNPVKEKQPTQTFAKSRFFLDYKRDEDFEEVISNCQSFTGEFLQTIREYKNLSIEKLSDMTKISKTYLRAIEAEEVDKLPADVYVRGFVLQYAKTLKLDFELVASSYMDHFRKLKNP